MILPFVVGETYRTQEGKLVTIVAANNTPHYECVQGDDISETTGEGIWRYNREGKDRGRVTGSPHDWSDPRNLMPVNLLMEKA